MVESNVGEKFKVFISYSRRDSAEFVDELVAGLELAGFAPFFDRHDIAAGEKWEERLGGLIAQADTVVFVVSPEAVKSERCAWEVERALARTKRVLPVIFKSVADSEIPEELRSRQFVRFDGGAGFARPLGQLAEALRQDIDWIREHTRLSELAARWDARGRPEALLLRGDDLAGTRLWADSHSPSAPLITDLIRAYIASSTDAEAASFAKSYTIQRRLIRMQTLLSAFSLLVIIGLIGWINQSYLKEEWRWYTVVRPFLQAEIAPYLLDPAAEQSLKATDVFRECAPKAKDKDYCPDMIVVPAGSFLMGSPQTEKDRSSNEGPQHTVMIAKQFAVSKFELTFDEWDTCVQYGDCPEGVSDGGFGRGFGRGQQPVVNVSWDDARKYIAWLSKATGGTYRLLSEAEYEYAARAGSTAAFPWGDEITLNGVPMGNCAGCGSKWDGRAPAPVGSFPPNKFGLYDMAGNVVEWTEDCGHPNYNGAPTDGSAWIAGACNVHVARGGGWVLPPDSLRSAARGGANTGLRVNFLGFRVARTLGR